MDRVRRLAGLWSWLPAFRTVAETEHLPTAARHLHVSPSALSRSVKQLEEALGVALFTRQGRRLVLAPAGRGLLEDVREAMRRLDDGVARAAGAEVQLERLRVAAQSPWIGALVAPALASTPVVVEHVDAIAEQVMPMLLRGEIDIAIDVAAIADDHLIVERLGSVELGLACGSSHRLARSRRAHDLGEARFAVCRNLDTWPAQKPRRIGFTSSQLGVVLDACVSGPYVGVLPVVLARQRGLTILPRERLAARALYLIRRRPLSPSRIDAVAASIRQYAAEVLSAAARRDR